jgi:NifU-like protein involved in Fe-S cluster formation
LVGRASYIVTYLGRESGALCNVMANDDFDAIYTARILELAADIPRLGRLAAPGATASARSPICGSKVTIDLSLGDDGRVADFAHDVRACALGQAASSLMARHIVGAEPAALIALREAVRAMLKENGPPPQGAWAEFAVLETVRELPSRHAATLLTFDAVAEALGKIAAQRPAEAAAGAKP